MDPLSATATLITVVGAALASTQILHQALTSLKNGSQAVRSLSNDVEQLQRLLDRLSHLPIHDASEMVGMADQVCLCSADVEAFKSKLELLMISGAKSRSSRLWRRLKLSVSERDMRQMQTVIRTHVSMLTLRLSLLQANMTANMTQSPQMYRPLTQSAIDAGANDGPDLSTNLQTPVDPPQSTTLSITGLSTVLGKLIQAVGHKERSFDSEDGPQITQHLETLLRSAQKHEVEVKEWSTGCDFTVTEGCVLEELKLVANGLSVAPSVDVNKFDPHRVFDTAIRIHLVEQHRKRKTIDLGEVQVAVSSTKRRMRFPQHHPRTVPSIEDTETTTEQSTIEQTQIDITNRNLQNTVTEHSAALLFKMAKSRHAVEVSVCQSLFPSYSFMFAAPRVSVINIRPRNSPVFQLAAHGNMLKLMALVSRGGASLRDHDTRGWSLLHYALPHPELCQFLIQQGLDVDEIVPLDEASTADSSVTPLHMAHLQESHGSAEVLLRGGGDPTIEVPLRHSVLHLASGRHTSSGDAILKHIFNISAYYGVATIRASGARSRPLGGWSALHSACYVGDNYLDESDSKRRSNIDDNDLGDSYSKRRSNIDDDDLEESESERRSNVRKISFLLEQGCSVHDTADDGSNCLHVFFSSRPSLALRYSWKDALMYLIGRGADVHGRDYQGWSVANLAYGEAFDERCAQESGSYFGDLWDAVLDCCGHDIQWFRRYHPRRAGYCGEYKRADFERLWEGREERCPYWDDSPWPELDTATERSTLYEGRAKRCRLPWVHRI